MSNEVGAWSAYEAKAWARIQARKKAWFDELAEETWSSRAGEKIAKTASGAGNAVRKLPGTAKAGAAFGMAVGKAQAGLADAAARTLSDEAVIKAHAKRGTAVSSLVGLRTLDLEVLDAVVHRKRLDRKYGVVAATEGLAAGAVVTGGQALATAGSVAGVGAGAAPGLGTVALAMAGDAAAVMALSSRAVAETAMHFGFDPNDPEEQLFMMSVINVGSAVTQGAKYTALADLSKMTQSLARRAPWSQLNDFILTQVAQKFADKFTVRLTQKKLGQLVPVAGMFVGSALNYGTVKSVQEAAYWAYRERLLLEKNPEASAVLDAEVVEWVVNESDASAEPRIAIGELVEQAEALEEFNVQASDEAPTASSRPPHVIADEQR